MLNIIVFCGGTGGVALQEGLNKLLGNERINLNLIINAYDNGKSTGECRRVFKRQILGPSDLRKNQLCQFMLKYEKELKDSSSYESRLLDLFSIRPSANDYKEYHKLVVDIVNQTDCLTDKTKGLFRSWIDYFFIDENKERETAKNILYNDFSVSNIFYASCAAMNGYSLEEAGTIMAEILGIDDNVKMVSGKNLFLKAKTESGHIIEDEEIIVEWDNPDDKICECILETSDGKRYFPSVGEASVANIAKLINEADIIIFSSGTQWSSLIPTYIHKGFSEMINSSKAKKYLVMNNIVDHDMYGVNADNLLETVKRYLNLDNTKIIVNKAAVAGMDKLSDEQNALYGILSKENAKKHDPIKLAGIIMEDYYKSKSNCSAIIADLDGTLWDECGDGDSQKVAEDNMRVFDGIILSGNEYEHVRDYCMGRYINPEREIYCDYGNSYFTLIDQDNVHTLLEEYTIDEEVFKILEKVPEFHGKCSLRGRTILTIKPLTNREEYVDVIKDILGSLKNKYYVRSAGRTSIDITVKGFTKAITISEIIRRNSLEFDKVLYIGNEIDGGNDAPIKDTCIKTLQVDDVYEMNNFLHVYCNIINGSSNLK